MLTFDNMRLEQKRVGEFLQLGLLFRETMPKGSNNTLKEVVDNIIEALSYFIESELYFRQLKRYDVFKIQTKREHNKLLNDLGEKANKSGRASLEKVLRSFETLQSEIETADLDIKSRKEFEEYYKRLRATLAECEMKTEDAKKLNEALTECLKAIKNKNKVLSSLIGLLTKNVQELGRLKRWSDKGLIILLGVEMIAFIYSVISSCERTTRSTYITALVTTALITLDY